MAKFVLDQTAPPKTIEIVIGDESYDIPLIGGLTFDEVREIETPEGTRALIERYIPEDILKPLTVDQYNSIVEAWKAESGIRSGE